MKKPLIGLSVLITRPKDQGSELIKLIEDAGGKAYHFPVMAISELSEKQYAGTVQLNREKVLNLDHYQHIVVISTNAAHYGLDLINHYWPQIPTGLKWYAIGQTTATALEKEQLGTVYFETKSTESGSDKINRAKNNAMNSEALLQHGNLQQLKNQKILIIRGLGGRDFLRQQLEQRGAKVDYLECYQRNLNKQCDGKLENYVEINGINAICINSAESVDYFTTLLNTGNDNPFMKLPVIVPSRRVADHAGEKGYSHVVVAENASNIAVAKALVGIIENKAL